MRCGDPGGGLGYSKSTLEHLDRAPDGSRIGSDKSSFSFQLSRPVAFGVNCDRSSPIGLRRLVDSDSTAPVASGGYCLIGPESECIQGDSDLVHNVSSGIDVAGQSDH